MPRRASISPWCGRSWASWRRPERKAPVVIDRAREHPRYKYFPETGEERFESLMAVPLMVRGMASGVLVVQTTVHRHFDQGDVDTLVTCAQLLTPVVVNAQMLQSVGRSDEELAEVYGAFGRLKCFFTNRSESKTQLCWRQS